MAKYSNEHIDRVILHMEHNRGQGWGDAVDVIRWLQEEVRRRDIALQDLTPGGSEFVNDPERCVAFVKQSKTSMLEQVKKAVRERNEMMSLLADLRMMFEDPRLPKKFAESTAKIPSGWKDKEERITRAFEAETGRTHPGPKENHARPHTEYREALAEWFKDRNIIGRLFSYRPSPLSHVIPKSGKCQHSGAEYDSGGAWCPDCGARGTFPGMG